MHYMGAFAADRFHIPDRSLGGHMYCREIRGTPFAQQSKSKVIFCVLSENRIIPEPPHRWMQETERPT